MKSSVLFLIPLDGKPLMGGRGLSKVSKVLRNFCISLFIRKALFGLLSVILYRGYANRLILAFRRDNGECLFSLKKLYHLILSWIIPIKTLYFWIRQKSFDFQNQLVKDGGINETC